MRPELAELSTLLRDLLDRRVVARVAAAPFTVGRSSPGVITPFVRADDSLAAALVVDLALASFTGAALTLVPAAEAHACARRGAPSPILVENLDEVANVLTALYRPLGRRVIRGRSIEALPMPPEIAALLAAPANRLLADVDIGGYGTGRLALHD